MLTGFLSWRRHVADWVAVAEIADRSVRRLKDVRGTVKAIVNLGAALIEAGRFEEAVSNLDTALLAGRVMFDSLDIDGRVLDDVGLALQELGDFAGAEWRHKHAIELFQELGDQRSEAAARNNAGIALERLGAHEQAIEAHSAAVEIFRGIGDRLSEAMALGNLAIALRGFGNRGEAIDVFAAARTAFEECGDRRSVGQTWRNVGVVCHEAGWLADAVTAFVAAALIFEKIGDWRSGTQIWRELEYLHGGCPARRRPRRRGAGDAGDRGQRSRRADRRCGGMADPHDLLGRAWVTNAVGCLTWSEHPYAA